MSEGGYSRLECILALVLRPFEAVVQNLVPREAYILNHWVELFLVATVFTLLIIVFMKYFGFLSRLRTINRRMLANAYEVLLFRRHPWTVILAELKLIWENMKLLAFLTPTLLFSGALFVLMSQNLLQRYTYIPAKVGEHIVIRAELPNNTSDEVSEYKFAGQGDMLEITAQVVSKAARTVWAGLRSSRPGLFHLRREDGSETGVVLNVGILDRPSLARQRVSGMDVEIGYPRRKWWAMKHGWIIWFSIVCLGVSLPLARLLKFQRTSRTGLETCESVFNEAVPDHPRTKTSQRGAHVERCQMAGQCPKSAVTERSS